MAYQILGTKKYHKFEELKIVSGHNSRKRNVMNADKSKEPNNIYLIGSKDIIKSAKQRIGERKIRKNGVIAVEILLSASPEYFRDNPDDYGVYDKDKLDAFNAKALEFVQNEFGADNVISAICHLDEATPHIHALIIPIDPTTNKLNASHWFDGCRKLSQLHDRCHDAMKEIGLERGVMGSEATHTTIRQFYGTLQADSPILLPKPEIQTPPLLLSEASRKAWAEAESLRINEQQAPFLKPISDQAKMAVINKKKARQAEQTAKQYAERGERMKKENAMLRSIELSSILEKYGAKAITKNRVYELNGENIAISPEGMFFNHYNGVHGSGAIDLVMHLEGHTDVEKAISWLGGNIDKNLAIGAAMQHARKKAENAVKKPTPLPAPVPQNWPHVRDYLVHTRQLDEKIIDYLYTNDLVYADFRRNACFRYGKNGVEKRGTIGQHWRGAAGTKEQGFTLSATDNPSGVIFVESSIDAISLAMLRKTNPDYSTYRQYDIVAVGGANTNIVFNLSKKYNHIVIGFDNDENQKGNNAYDDIKQFITNAERLNPAPYKDWNEYLVIQRKTNVLHDNTQHVTNKPS